MSLNLCVPDIKESQNIASLHNQITACDSILEVRITSLLSPHPPYSSPSPISLTSSPSRLSQRMEQMLSSFQADLSSISCEIQTLQEQSVAMNIKLKNRQSVRSELSQLVDELVVPSTMIG